MVIMAFSGNGMTNLGNTFSESRYLPPGAQPVDVVLDTHPVDERDGRLVPGRLFLCGLGLVPGMPATNRLAVCCPITRRPFRIIRQARVTARGFALVPHLLICRISAKAAHPLAGLLPVHFRIGVGHGARIIADTVGDWKPNAELK